MNIFQLIGVLVIVNALIWAAWTHSQMNRFGWGAGLLLSFALVAGLALIFYKRQVEVSFGKEGATIRAAAERANTDAAEVASIRQRIETQAATIDLVAHDSAEAKKLLEGLRAENKRADEKLKLLEEKTSQIINLPDGRTKNGGTVSGEPLVLSNNFTQMQSAYREKRYADAYSYAKECVRVYEETDKILSSGPVMIMGGDLNPEGVSRFYAIASEAISRTGDNDLALTLHEKALKAMPKPDAEFLANHVVALIKAGRKNDAQQLIDETMKKPDPFASEFRAKLVEIHVLDR